MERARVVIAMAGILVLAAIGHALAPSARGQDGETALGIPCGPGPGAVRICEGSVATLVPSWDGVPLDATITLPPAGLEPPYPLIVGLHGFGVNKLAGFDGPETSFEYAQDGYATLAYSARGLGFSCGFAVTRALPGCEKGWIHLADARYEARDTQYLAGRLLDEGLVRPAIGVTGTSYGGGQSLLLATLRDRVMLPDGRLVRWRSPQGTPMRIAAAAPKIGWSDLGHALVPNGRTLDYRPHNPYGRRVGFPKQSYLQALFTVGLGGYYAPPGADPEADIQTWKAWLDAGQPYPRRLKDFVLRQIQRYHSAYYLQDRLPRRQRRAPAPLVIYNGWTDDIMPATEPLRYYAKVKRQFPQARIGLIFEAAFAHNRGSLAAEAARADDAAESLFARYLKGERSRRPLQGVITTTQSCDDTAVLGPFRTPTWRAQHPGEVRIAGGAPQTFDSGGGETATSLATDPFFGASECPTVAAERDPGAATYQMRAAGPRGFTLVGMPTVVARLGIEGRWPQIVGRLWDVGPDGRQTLVSHGIYAPPASGGRVVFQLEPNAWRFAPGHAPKLELLGRDSPYAQPSNGRFEITVRRLVLELPVRERPDSRRIKPYAPPR